MTTIFKNNSNLLEEYLKNIISKCKEKMPIIKDTKKMSNDKIIIPTIKNYNDLLYYNYNVAQLKMFAKTYGIKLSGNKNQLLIRLYSFLYFSYYIIKIQKIFRTMLVKKYKTLRGPAINNRKICNNNNDFITMEPIEEINFHQFISYKDVDGFIYGFDINSLHNLIIKTPPGYPFDIKNPYNRNNIPDIVLKNISSLLRISKIIKININLNFEDDSKKVSDEKAIELQALTLFQNINALGNYSDVKWFLSLNRTKLLKFIRELIDIWEYRAQLPIQTKRNICPPNGNPFMNININYYYNEQNILKIKQNILEIMKNLVNYGIDNDSKSLGAYYILGALTLVNTEAATALPWLFQSVI